MNKFDERKKIAYELSKNLDEDICHVRLYGPKYEDDSLVIDFIDGPLKGKSAKVDLFMIE